MTLLNLLVNYIPLVLTIYSTSFKLNNFFEYFNAMIRIWTMFMCLERHHYDKAPLVWIAMCTYWGINNPDLYLMLRLFLVILMSTLWKMPLASLDQRQVTVTQLNRCSRRQRLHFNQKQRSIHLNLIFPLLLALPSVLTS